MTTIEIASYKELVAQLIKFQENQVLVLQKLADLIPKPKEDFVTVKQIQSTSMQDITINKRERDVSGEDMSAEELAELFGLEPEKEPIINWSEMDENGIKALEAAQNNALDIYKVKARVTNLARESGAGITPNGEAMVNTYIHVLMSLYAFAAKIKDRTLRNEFIELVRSKEGFPGDVINITLPRRT